MGRYELRPSRVYKTAGRALGTIRLRRQPSWYETVGAIPPSQILVRMPPVQHDVPSLRRRKQKPSKAFMPQHITYDEDALRKQFFSDHPWELARPRTVLETDGKDYQRQDWSHLRQKGRKVDGESVIQRQMWLANNQAGMTKDEAYDQARKEFYAERLQQEADSRVAKEEALATSAYFGKSRVQIGAELEGLSYERWRKMAHDEFVKMESRFAATIPSDPATEAESPVDQPEVVDITARTLSNETSTPGR